MVHILHLIEVAPRFGETENLYIGHTLIFGVQDEKHFERIFDEFFDCFNAERFKVLHSTCEESEVDYDCDLEHMQRVEDIDEDNPFLLDNDDCRRVWHKINNHKYGQRMTFMESVAAMWDAYDGVNLAHVRGCNI